MSDVTLLRFFAAEDIAQISHFCSTLSYAAIEPFNLP